MSADIAHEIIRVSGSRASDCCFIAQRYDAAYDGFRPGSGESYVCTVTPERVRLEIGGPGWLTGIWRAPDRSIYVSDMDSRVYVLPRGEGDRWDIVPLQGALIGIWGVDDQCVWTWGMSGEKPVLYNYDGRSWQSVPTPGEIVALGGVSRDLVFAVGHRALIARWNGDHWTEMECPAHESLHGVCVVSDNEAYAIGPSGVFLEGSVYGWVERERRESMLYSIVAHRGTVYVGGEFPDGLMKLTADGLDPIARELTPFQMDGREDLLLATPQDVLSSSDAKSWYRVNVDTFVQAVKNKPPAWR